MPALDTNVLVRYLMQDDAAQAAKASRLIERCSAEEPGFIAMVVLVELVWVLESSYGIERARIAAALELLLRTRELRVEQAGTAWHAVRMYRDSRADFADTLIARCAAAAGCERTLTFDRDAARLSGMALL